MLGYLIPRSIKPLGQRLGVCVGCRAGSQEGDRRPPARVRACRSRVQEQQLALRDVGLPSWLGLGTGRALGLVVRVHWGTIGKEAAW